MNVIDQNIRYLNRKIEMLEFQEKDFEISFNNMVDNYVTLYEHVAGSGINMEIFNQFSSTLVDYIEKFNISHSQFQYILLNELFPQFYIIKAVMKLSGYKYFVNNYAGKRILTITGQEEVNLGIELDILNINNYGFDFINIKCEEYEEVVAGLIYLSVSDNIILPSSYPSRNSIETFQPESFLNLKNKNFSLISDDCWGGFLYKQLGLSYNTPFMWLYIRNNDYLKLISDVAYYLNQKIKFINIPGYNHPIGLLGDVHIFFNHYRNAEEAEGKWKKRLERFNWDNIYYKFSAVSEEDASIFNVILKETDKKVSFSPQAYDYPQNIHLTGWQDEEARRQYVGFYQYLHLHSNKYFDAVEWLNGSGNFRIQHNERID
ncbi:DUF1919 domain-containing protein [Paenibacillus albidus]|uniref:DUF1919 domain-containing protein n=1 Tax=Paenibacillus albidus TaxID=2041023 RepID=UPI001BE4E58B|nr:DUF1919 domain-containing protein [Paenibacillus albidus]